MERILNWRDWRLSTRLRRMGQHFIWLLLVVRFTMFTLSSLWIDEFRIQFDIIRNEDLRLVMVHLQVMFRTQIDAPLSSQPRHEIYIKDNLIIVPLNSTIFSLSFRLLIRTHLLLFMLPWGDRDIMEFKVWRV